MTRVLAGLFADKILRCLDRIVAMLDGLSEDEAGWTPDIEGGNSVAGIANHILANVEENVLVVLTGGDAARDRSAEFTPGSANEVIKRWRALRPRIAEILDEVDDAALLSECEHPRRGRITAGELLMVIRSHAAEHEGQAALTRDLVVAKR